MWAVRGWRLDRTWGLLAAAIIAFWVADSHYLVAVANDTYAYPSAFDGGWTACVVLFALAAWQHPSPARPPARTRARSASRRGPRRSRRWALAVLVVAALLHLNPVAVALAALSLAAVLLRLVVSLRDNAAMLKASRAEALTDALTGLGNRRALMRDLDERLEARRRPSLLALFDLDGFKPTTTPSATRPATRCSRGSARKLAARSRGPDGGAYRMGGDEFCVLLDAGATDDPGARRRRGAGRAAATASRSALLRGGRRCPPRPARPARRCASPTSACTRTSTAAARRRAARARDVLLRALAERDPDLGDHLSGVAELAEAVARRLGLDDDAVERGPPRRRAARRRQDRDPRRDPRQARAARRRPSGRSSAATR